MYARYGSKHDGAGSRPLRGSCRYLRIVLRSRSVCLAIADTDQPRAASAWISTSSSCVSIPLGALPSTVAWHEHPRPSEGPRTERADAGSDTASARPTGSLRLRLNQRLYATSAWGIPVIDSGEKTTVRHREWEMGLHDTITERARRRGLDV